LIFPPFLLSLLLHLPCLSLSLVSPLLSFPCPSLVPINTAKRHLPQQSTVRKQHPPQPPPFVKEILAINHKHTTPHLPHPSHVSSSDIIHWKDCGRRRSWPNFRYYPSIREGLGKVTQYLSVKYVPRPRCTD
jgi:hypothetical protein